MGDAALPVLLRSPASKQQIFASCAWQAHLLTVSAAYFSVLPTAEVMELKKPPVSSAEAAQGSAIVQH